MAYNVEIGNSLLDPVPEQFQPYVEEQYMRGFNCSHTTYDNITNSMRVLITPGVCIMDNKYITVVKDYFIDFGLSLAGTKGFMILTISYSQYRYTRPHYKLFWASNDGNVEPDGLFNRADSNLILGIYRIIRDPNDETVVTDIEWANPDFHGVDINIQTQKYHLYNQPLPNVLSTRISPTDIYPGMLQDKLKGGRNINVGYRYNNGNEFLRVEINDPDNINLNYNPNQYTPVDVPGLASGNRVATHLCGIDTEFGHVNQRINDLENNPIVGGAGWEAVMYDLTQTDIDNKYVDLPSNCEGSYANRAMISVQGTVQQSGIDFAIIDSGTGLNRVSWNSYALENLLLSGDRIVVYYRKEAN